MFKEEISKLIKQEKINTLGNLYDRWTHEKEYEDFKDYITYIKNMFPENFIKATKKPFKIFLKLENPEYFLILHVTKNKLTSTLIKEKQK